jgi:hypothetical protein
MAGWAWSAAAVLILPKVIFDPLSLRGAFATRQSATAHALDRIAASQTLLAMTNEAGQ